MDVDRACAAVMLGATALPGAVGAGPVAPKPQASMADELGTVVELTAAQRALLEPATEQGLQLVSVRPAEPVVVERAVSPDGHDPWFSTDWPGSDRAGDGVGDPAHNLWASGGALDKVDRVGGPDSGAAAHDRRRPAAIDLGVGVKLGVRRPGEQFGGSDAAALCALLFDRPTRTVAINGVDFQPRDIEGLLTLVAAQLPVDVVSVGDRARRDEAPIAPWLLRATVLEWAMEGGGIAETRPKGSLAARPFTSAEDRVWDVRPAWAEGEAEPELAAGLTRTWGELTIDFPDRARTYNYLVDEDADGAPVSGQFFDRIGDPAPSLLWKPRSLDLDWPDRLSRNPHVPVELIETLYENSVDL